MLTAQFTYVHLEEAQIVLMEASRHRLKYAIVVKGPLVAFTRACMGHYLTTMPDVGVVFSHNRGCAGSAAQQPTLEELQNRYPATFGFVLAEPPLELGIGFRNVQREATYHGVRHAIELWRPRWVLAGPMRGSCNLTCGSGA